MLSSVDHVEAALERLQRAELEQIPPARRQRLASTLAAWGRLCDRLGQRSGTPAARPRSRRDAGVLADLSDGRGRE